MLYVISVMQALKYLKKYTYESSRIRSEGKMLTSKQEYSHKVLRDRLFLKFKLWKEIYTNQTTEWWIRKWGLYLAYYKLTKNYSVININGMNACLEHGLEKNIPVYTRARCWLWLKPWWYYASFFLGVVPFTSNG